MTIRRSLLIFDLDENLISISGTKDAPGNLRHSAELTLSPEGTDGCLMNQPVKEGINAYRIRALSRSEWLAIFERIKVINANYASLNPRDDRPLIGCMVLTNSIYDRRCVMDILGKMFGADLINTLFSPDFSQFNYYNVIDQRKLMCTNKGLFIHTIWNILKTVYGLSVRKEVLLIDDSISNINDMNAWGFNGLHNPTVQSERRERFFSYSTICPTLFEKINLLIDEIATQLPPSEPTYTQSALT